MSRFSITRLFTTGTRSSVLGVQTFSSSSSRFFSSSSSSSSRLFSTSSSSTNHSKLSTPDTGTGTGISENLKPVESVALPSQSPASVMNQSVYVSPSVDQDVPVTTNVTSSSELLGWISDISQHPLSPEPGQVLSFFATSAAIATAVYATRTFYAHLGLWTRGHLDAIINHYRDEPPKLVLSESIQDEEKNTLVFPLNPNVGKLIKQKNVLLIEGGPGEGKTTQVFRTLLDKCSQTSTGQRPLILLASFRGADLKTKFLSRFFVKYPFFFKVTNYEALLSAVVKRAVDKKIPVYIVTDDVQQVVDMYPVGNVGDAAQSFFGTLMQLSLDYPKHVKIVHIANRMFSQDLSKFSGHMGRLHAYQWSYDPTLFRSTLEQSNNRTIVRHVDELLGMFGSKIQDYIGLMELMDNVDNEEAYQAAVKQMKDTRTNDIMSALSAVKKVYRVAGAAEAHKLLTELLEEQGKAVSPVNIADPNIVDILVRSNIIHSKPTVTWASRFTSFVFKERYNEFVGFRGKSTPRKE